MSRQLTAGLQRMLAIHSEGWFHFRTKVEIRSSEEKGIVCKCTWGIINTFAELSRCLIACIQNSLLCHCRDSWRVKHSISFGDRKSRRLIWILVKMTCSVNRIWFCKRIWKSQMLVLEGEKIKPLSCSSVLGRAGFYSLVELDHFLYFWGLWYLKVRGTHRSVYR